MRDNLIAQQESLLNTYRCRFNIDTQIVPVGCTDGKPSRGPTEPDAFEGVPTQADIAVRDNLIALQESLLNTYRCRFNIDTQIVPGGCTEGKPASTEPSEQTQSGSYTAMAVGVQHTCALRTDQTIACWGDSFQQANAPAGQFTAVSAGHEHVCALRTDQTIACWGDNTYRQGDAPAGQFTAVSAGAFLTCGLRTNGTITCWGSDSHGASRAPAGQFTAVSAGTAFACALRTDDTITCWGNNTSGQADAPAGQYTAIASGDVHACGLRADTRVYCWGRRGFYRTNVPNGHYSAIAVASRHSCGLRTDDTITCWGESPSGQAHAPDGQFTAITAGGEQSCGLRTDQTITCWGTALGEPTSPPDGQFTAITAGAWHTCGLRTDQTITCWGHDYVGRASPPDGQFTAITAGAWHTCGLRTDQTIACWGINDQRQADPPEGQFTAITAGFKHTCGVRSNTATICWGNNREHQLDVPFMQFSAITAGQRHSCGLRFDAAIACWGHSGRLADPPEGEFSEITAGNRHTCALRIDATIVCWGLRPFVPAPAGVQRLALGHRADPDMCRPQALWNGTTAGFPLPSWAPSATGTVRVAVLFMDFPDAAATHSTHEEAKLGLPYAESYLESASYGQLDIEFVPLHKWLRVEDSYTNHIGDSDRAWPLLQGVNGTAVQLADPEFDFTGYDVVMVVMPSSHFGGANAGGSVDTQEGSVSQTSRINTKHIDDGPQDPTPWGSSAAHELAHNFGLLDLYAFDGRVLPDTPAGKVRAGAAFGLMGLGTTFLANLRDPRFAHVWHYPNGQRSTEYHYALPAREMLAWSRWQLGWLNASQIRCVTEPEAVVNLSLIAADPGDGIAMAAIPLSDTEVIVIESRRKTGYDVGTFYRSPHGLTFTLPALPVEGVLVYTVDAAIGNGNLPLKVAGDPGNGHVDDYPILTAGQSVTIRGYTITVQAATPTTHTVSITKTDSASG